MAVKGITDEQIAEAIAKTAGNVTLIAEQLKCSRQNIDKRIKASEELLKLQAESVTRVTEIAIAVVVDKIVNKKDVTTAQWWLDRKAKHLGFTRQLEHVGSGGAPIQHAVTAEVMSPSTPEEIAAARRRFIDDGDDEGA